MASELESLAHILARIATSDGVHWRHEAFESIGMIDAMYAGWTLHFESKMLLRIEEEVFRRSSTICSGCSSLVGITGRM